MIARMPRLASEWGSHVAGAGASMTLVLILAVGCSKSPAAGAAKDGGPIEADRGSGGSTVAGAGGAQSSSGGSGGGSAVGTPPPPDAGHGPADARVEDAGRVGMGCELAGQSLADKQSMPAPDGCNTCRCDDGVLACTDAVCVPPCVVAMRLDDCCLRIVAVPRAELADDECLYQYPAWAHDREREQRCRDAQPDCTDAMCTSPRPVPSRVAKPDDTGGCRFVDECESDADCIAALERGACCGCIHAAPLGLLDANRCVVPQGEDMPSGCPSCVSMQCEICNPPPERVVCDTSGEFNRCSE